MANFSQMLKRLGLAKESVRGTAEATPLVWVAISPDSEIEFKLQRLTDETVRGVKSKFPSGNGMIDIDGTIKFPLRASDAVEFFDMLIDVASSAEASAFTVTAASNDKIDFKEDGGGELTATLTAGNFPMGASSAVVGSLCEEIKTRLEAAGTGTYTVTYDFSTKKVTIAVAGAIAAVQIVWLTGTNTATSAATLLGFTVADTASAASVTSDSTTGQFAFQHTITPGTSLLPQSYTLYLDRSLSVKEYNGVNAGEIKLTRSPDNFIMMETAIMGRTEAAGLIGTPVFVESEEMSFQNDTFTIGGVATTEVKAWEVSLKNGLFKKRATTQDQLVDDLLALENTAEGTFTIYFADEVERAKFVAGTTTTLVIDINGDTIQGSEKYNVNLNFGIVNYEAFPFGDEDGLLAAKVVFRAHYDNANNRLYQVLVTNITQSY